VLDLVHPSLYPIVYGRTLAYPEGCTDHDASKLKPVSAPQISAPDEEEYWAPDEHYHLSQKFQWLPTDFVVSSDGKSVKSLGYINNLHPVRHAELQNTIEELVTAYVPLFERVLTDSILENKAVPDRTFNGYSYDEGYEPRPSYTQLGDGGAGDSYGELYEKWEAGRPIRLPEVSKEGYVPGSLEHRRIRYTLAGKTIQVIVKLANIHLVSSSV
jgi:hypothetical protein